jgi:hypothetical protein
MRNTTTACEKSARPFRLHVFAVADHPGLALCEAPRVQHLPYQAAFVRERPAARPQQLGEALGQGRPHEAPERRGRGNLAPEARQRVLETARDAHARIREGAVQVEEDVHGVNNT